jgi:hypothetical protein
VAHRGQTLVAQELANHRGLNRIESTDQGNGGSIVDVRRECHG